MISLLRDVTSVCFTPRLNEVVITSEKDKNKSVIDGDDCNDLNLTQPARPKGLNCFWSLFLIGQETTASF